MIRKVYKSEKLSQCKLARLFGVNQGQISRVINGLRWTGLEVMEVF